MFVLLIVRLRRRRSDQFVVLTDGSGGGERGVGGGVILEGQSGAAGRIEVDFLAAVLGVEVPVGNLKLVERFAEAEFVLGGLARRIAEDFLQLILRRFDLFARPARWRQIGETSRKQ